MPATLDKRTDEISRVWRWREALCASTDPELTDARKLIGLRLSFHYDYDRGTTWAPIEGLAAECASTERTVTRALSVLRESGALVMTEQARQHRSPRYRLAIPSPVTPDTPENARPVTPDTPESASDPSRLTPDPSRLTRRGDTPDRQTRQASHPSSSLSDPRRGQLRGTTDGQAADPAPADAGPVAATSHKPTGASVDVLDALAEARRQIAERGRNA